MDPKNRTVEAKLSALAGKSHGVVTRAELLGADVSQTEIKRRIRSGALIRIHRGVFRVGHLAPSLEARYTAAVKACGPEALLAGRAAAHLLGLLRRPPSQPEVLCVTERRIPSLITRRARGSDVVQRRGVRHLRDSTSWHGVPVTTAPRTIVDLAAGVDEEELGRAFHQAVVRHRTTAGQVDRALARRHNWPGAGKLRRVIWGDAPITLSRLESLFLRRLREAALPQPDVNRRIDGHYVDCRWPEARLTVELDGYRYHHTRHAWEQDRRRERAARRRGDDFRRYTWLDVVEDPAPMLRDLRPLLGGPGLMESR